MNTVHPQECTENIDRVKIAEITSIEFHSAGHENVCVNFFFLLYKKMCECNSIECNSVEKAYYQRNRDVILNRAKDYYENDKKRLREQARYKYRNLSEEEKTKKENMEKIYIIICLKKRNKD